MGQALHWNCSYDAEQDMALPIEALLRMRGQQPRWWVPWWKRAGLGLREPGGYTLVGADCNWDTRRRLEGNTVTSDKKNIAPNLLTIAWPIDFLIVFILNSNLKKWLGSQATPWFLSEQLCREWFLLESLIHIQGRQARLSENLLPSYIKLENMKVAWDSGVISVLPDSAVSLPTWPWRVAI